MICHWKRHLPWPRSSKKEGYKTFLLESGTWVMKDFFPEDQGFEINKGGHDKGSPPGGYFSPYKNPKLKDGPEGEHLTDRLTDESIRFISQNQDNPFLLYLSYYTVHTPIQAHPDYLSKFQAKKKSLKDTLAIKIRDQGGYTVQNQYNADYASMVYALDKNVGRLINQLESLKMLNNTLIIFTSDNGGLTTLGEKIELLLPVFCLFELERDGSMKEESGSPYNQNPKKYDSQGR